MGSKRTVAEAAQPVYRGPVGRTEKAHIHVTIPGGHVRSVEVYVGVDVVADPKLKEAAVSGALHRFDGGEELAIPFVYHDPKARKLALVLPETLRHRELEERAGFLERLAKDTEHEIPRYVRLAHVVIGSAELAAFLASEDDGAPMSAKQRKALDERDRALAAREAAVTAREAELESREETLVGRESRLAARAEEVTRREDEERSIGELIEAQQRDIELQQRELERRLKILQDREQAARAPHKSSVPPPLAITRVANVEDVVDDADVEEIQELEPVSTDTNVIAASDVEFVEAVEELEEVQDSDGVQEVQDIQDVQDVQDIQDIQDIQDVQDAEAISLGEEVEEIIGEDDVEELDEADMINEVTGVTSNPSEVPDAADQQSGSYPRAAVPPPAGFLGDRTIEMAARYEDAVWLFARLDEGHESGFRNGADLLVQLSMVQGYPVVILALVDTGGEGRPYVRRAALDPRDAGDREILEALRSDFEATVALFGPSGRFERTVEVAALRRVNVAMLLERVGRIGTAEAKTDAATAKERALTAPPPLRGKHPFVAEVSAVGSAAEAANALTELVTWTTPEKLDEVLLTLSVPRDVVDAAIRQILHNAVDRGLALTPELTKRAITVGVAPDEETLVVRQLERFRETTADDDCGGLELSDVASNWEQLLESAGEQEVAVEVATHERAWKAIRRHRGPATGNHDLAEVDPAKLPDMGKPELIMLLDHPKLRREAALELCRRSDPDMLETLYKAVRKMPRAEVVRIVPRIVGYGEAAGDALIDGLSARKTFVRQASALGLGELKLRRAVVPLAHALIAEESDVWPEMARVLGTFGSSAFRQVARSLKDPKGQDERLKVTLAHLANHGCEDKVDALSKDPDKTTAVIALEAMTLRHDLKRTEKKILTESAPDLGDAVLQFSNRFYMELKGTAPEGDLQ